MANIKISALTSVTSLAAADTFPVVQSGSTKKAAISDISALMLSTAPQTSFRNLLINGSFIVNQRNSLGYTITAGAALQYTVDRWYAFCTGTNVTVDNSLSSGKRRFQITGATSNTGWGFGQRIEGGTTCQIAGGSVTLSAQVYGVSTTSPITWTAYSATSLNSFGTLASPTRTQLATGTFPVTSFATKNTATFTTSAGTAANGIEIVFSGGALTGTQSVGFFDVQLESGSVATVFEQRPMAIEHQMCMRYYEKNYQYAMPAATPTTAAIYEIYGASNGSGNMGTFVKFATPKRNTTYTTTFYTPGGVAGSWTHIRSGVSATSVAIGVSGSGASEYGFPAISSSVGATWTVGTLGGYWVVDNEL
jgi:hypothetical protein